VILCKQSRIHWPKPDSLAKAGFTVQGRQSWIRQPSKADKVGFTNRPRKQDTSPKKGRRAEAFLSTRKHGPLAAQAKCKKVLFDRSIVIRGDIFCRPKTAQFMRF